MDQSHLQTSSGHHAVTIESYSIPSMFLPLIAKSYGKYTNIILTNGHELMTKDNPNEKRLIILINTYIKVVNYVYNGRKY